ncbi:alpha/beta-hydrolase [Ceratobasidium sp. AG-I]|nr:alpha/beta-hydrolase [Ceratobasidium sp. AG-I]
MFALHFVRLSVVLGAFTSLVAAVPVPGLSLNPTSGPVLCPMSIVNVMCRKDEGEVRVLTPVGMARGLQAATASSRFVVKYATATRWGLPTVVTSWTIAGSSVDQLPPVCPQANGVDPSTYSEDCLYFIAYTPPATTLNVNPPITVWIHGGSFEVGSATGPGLDGAALAKATNSIVVVVQYRLGVLGLVPPTMLNANSNLGVRDVIAALQFIKAVGPSFGADIDQITVAGQSSGGQMIRALLASPSATSLFKSAAIHSDTMDYGFYKPQTISDFQTYFYKNTVASIAACSTLACLQAVPVADILNGQQQLRDNAMNWGFGGVAFGGSPLRPYHDGQLIQYTLTGNSFPSGSALKPLLVMTVKDEAAVSVGYSFPTPDSATNDTVNMVIGAYYPTEASVLVSSDNYNTKSYVPQDGVATGDEARTAITQFFTDAFWRCPNWTFSRQWAAKGGKVYTGVFQVGATYPSNQGIAYCNTGGRVCHEDDIYILFGTTPSATSAQTALTQEIQARYSSFIRTQNPNPSSSTYAAWAQSGTSDVAALKLGGTGNVPAEACDPSFWGNTAKYDYQIYGL